jgi:membrane protein DedA with SNARE-associated domain
MLESFIQSVSAMSPAWFYLALFASAYVENVFPPVPGDTVTVFAAYIVGRTQQRFAGVLLATTLGSVAGFMTYYLVGRLVPLDSLLERDSRFFPAATIRRAGDWFQRYGYWVVLGNRFLSGIRSVISLVAGLYRLPWPRVLVLATLSCAVWNGLLIWAGYLLGANWRAIEEILRAYARWLAIAAILAAGVWITRKKLARPPRP